MHFREATLADIPQLMEIRFSVTENVLSDPALVPAESYVLYLTERGKGWVCEAGPGQLLGFAIADMLGHNIRALFVRPGYEGRRIGQRSQRLVLDWYFHPNPRNRVVGHPRRAPAPKCFTAAAAGAKWGGTARGR